MAIINGYGKPGFTIPLDVAAVAGMSNGADPFVIINAQLEALDLPPLDPPQIIKDIRSQMTPFFRELLFNERARAQARARAVQQGLSQTSGDTSAFRQPMRMRAGSTFRRTSSNNTIGNILSNLTDADWDELGYVVSSEAARNTDDEFGVAASVLTRLASGKYGNSIGEIIRAPGQYEAVYKGMARYEPTLSSKLKSAEGREKIRNFFTQLDGRTDFKGQTMLKNRVASEDPMFAPSGNFYHYAGQ